MNENYVKVTIKDGSAEVKIHATRSDVACAVSALSRDIIENDFLPDLDDITIRPGYKIAAALSLGIHMTTLSLSSQETVIEDLISALKADLKLIKTMKGEN